jgi:hypothetical protein
MLMMIWGLPEGESFWNSKTFVDTYLWSKNRDVDFVKELHIMVLNTIE